MPRRHRKEGKWGYAPGSASGLQSRAEPEPGAQPKSYFLRYGGAQPRLTSGGIADSGGEAAMKIAEGGRRQTATCEDLSVKTSLRSV
jgi:hypothetical protein